MSEGEEVGVTAGATDGAHGAEAGAASGAGASGGAGAAGGAGSGAGRERAEAAMAEFLRELRRRGVDETGAAGLAERLGPAVSRLTDRLVVLACDRLARREMVGFYEALLEGMSSEERRQWRAELTAEWRRAVLDRLALEAELRREVLETILWLKAVVWVV